ncbi:MAG: class I SAM-dependent methyltransferase [Gemmatimonadota bacterium]|nr:class I SAM-dependent methyltransferase [Gemmatimonadota bacterium]
MNAAAIPAVSGGVEACERVLRLAFGDPESREFSVRYWDGSETPAGVRPRFTLVLRHPGALRRMLLPPSELRLGEAFVRGDFDVEGDLEAAAAVGDALPQRFRQRGVILGLLDTLPRLPRAGGMASLTARRPARTKSEDMHTEERDRLAVRSHYDVGNDFYALWLDPRMVYSCGYFPTGTESLAAAQAAKLDHVCRKLRLRANDRLLDIGCGCGALVEWAGANYGARAFGITVSEPQAQYADGRLFDAALVGRCGVAVLDYRQIGPPHEYDRIASIGMVEHVGRIRLAQYFRTAYSVLRPGGLFLAHGIVAAPEQRAPGLAAALGRRVWQAGAFIDRYVFPDGELVTLGEMIAAAETAGFEVRDVESLRDHYTRTLRHWVRRLEAREREAVALVGTETYRTWRLYMAASAHAFTSGRLNVVQILLAKRDAAGRVEVPPSRADLYSADLQSRTEAS